jgi:hypothetical protein
MVNFGESEQILKQATPEISISAVAAIMMLDSVSRKARQSRLSPPPAMQKYGPRASLGSTLPPPSP